LTISAAGKPQSDHAIGRKLHKNIKSENQKSETRGGRKERRGCAESSLTNSTVAELEAGRTSGCWLARLNLARLGRLMVEWPNVHGELRKFNHTGTETKNVSERLA